MSISYRQNNTEENWKGMCTLTNIISIAIIAMGRIHIVNNLVYHRYGINIL